MATIASLLRERVSLQVNSVDRIFLAGYVPKLQSDEFAGLTWPQCDGLIWPHLPSECDLMVRVLSSADRRSQKGCREWSCLRRSGGITSSTGCRRMRWRVG